MAKNLLSPVSKIWHLVTVTICKKYFTFSSTSHYCEPFHGYSLARTMASKINNFRFIEIAANIGDPVYKGNYRGKQAHADDFMQMINRAKEHGVEKIMITGGSLTESKHAIETSKLDDCLYATVGCHPTRTNEFEEKSETPDEYLRGLIDLVKQNKDKVVAVGEMGLDYERLQFSSKETQLRYFEKQMNLIEETNLPVFFHCREAYEDFANLVSRFRDIIPGGVVHSFDGTKEEAAKMIEIGYYIGINGCSLKTQDNIDVMCSIPMDRLMIETDCPYCEIRSTHAGHKYIKTLFEQKKKEKHDPQYMVKGRNEPCTIVQVLEVMSAVREEDPQQLADTMYDNTMKLFFGGKDKSTS